MIHGQENVCKGNHNSVCTKICMYKTLAVPFRSCVQLPLRCVPCLLFAVSLDKATIATLEEELNTLKKQLHATGKGICMQMYNCLLMYLHTYRSALKSIFR